MQFTDKMIQADVLRQHVSGVLHDRNVQQCCAFADQGAYGRVWEGHDLGPITLVGAAMATVHLHNR